MSTTEPAATGAPLRTPPAGAEASGPVPSAGLTEASLAVMVLIWGVNFSVVKGALGVFEPHAFNALRFLLASGFVLAVLRARNRLRLPDRADLPRLIVLGVLGNVLYQVGFILGLDRTRAGNAALMLAVMPVIVMLLGVRAGERHRPRAWFGVAASALGVALVTGSALRLEGREALVGDLILIGAATAWAFYTVNAKPYIDRYGSLQTTAWTLWAGAIVLVLIGIPSLIRQDWEAVGPGAWGALFYSGLLSIGLSYLLWYRGVARLGGARTAIYSNLTPVVGLVVGAVWLGERITAMTLLGAALVVGGVVMVRD